MSCSGPMFDETHLSQKKIHHTFFIPQGFCLYSFASVLIRFYCVVNFKSDLAGRSLLQDSGLAVGTSDELV